jgi:hypothetical protein
VVYRDEKTVVTADDDQKTVTAADDDQERSSAADDDQKTVISRYDRFLVSINHRKSSRLGCGRTR